MIEEEERILLYYDNENKSKSIKLNSEERFIDKFTFMKIDVTVVKILPEDNIQRKYFLFQILIICK